MGKLYNPTSETSQFIYASHTYEVGPHEAKVFDDLVVRHYRLHVNGPLEVVEDEAQEVAAETSQESSTPIKPEDMSWTDLRRYAADKGVFQSGMTKEALLEAIKNAD